MENIKQEKMKKCKFCQEDIPVKATVCPNCKRSLKKSHGCLVAFLMFFIISVGGVGATISMNDGIQKSMSGVSDNSEYITLEEYYKIDTGMSYDEVKNIIGSHGELTSKVDSNGYVIEMYTWYGNGIAGSNANVTFENGKMTAKAQFGLE